MLKVISKDLTSAKGMSNVNDRTNRRSYNRSGGQGMFHKLSKLKWTSTPYRWLPHGLSGMVLVISGLYLIHCGHAGYLGPFGLGPHHQMYKLYGVPYIQTIFYVSATMNSIGGFIMAPRAMKFAIPIFRSVAVAVLCLVYYAIRFSPEFEMVSRYNYITNDGISMSRTVGIVRLLDIICGIVFVGVTLSICKVSYDFRHTNKAIAIGICVAAFGISTLTTFPIQNAIDPNWWDCTIQNYPLQGMALVTYAYIPSIFIFSISVFLPTLYLRNIITDVQMSVTIAVLVGSILISTALAMEWILPDVTTQRLYIPCNKDLLFNINNHNDGNESWQLYWMNTFDISVATRNIIRQISGREVPPSLYTHLP
jgi:hypothetical protein